MSNLITAEEILKAEDTRYAYVPVDEWSEGKLARLKSLSAKDAVDWNSGQGMVEVIMKSVVDGDGKLLFTRENVEALKEKSFAVFNRIQTAAMTLNGMSGTMPKVLIKND